MPSWFFCGEFARGASAVCGTAVPLSAAQNLEQFRHLPVVNSIPQPLERQLHPALATYRHLKAIAAAFHLFGRGDRYAGRQVHVTYDPLDALEVALELSLLKTPSRHKSKVLHV